VKRIVLTAALALGLTLPAMVAGAIPQPIYLWGSVATTTPTTATTTSASFYWPSHNLGCEIDDGRSGVPAQVYCQSKNPPSSVHMGLDGKLRICSGTGAATRCTGDVGENTPTLAYGKQITVGRFRCQSLRSGIKCTVVSSGKGFLFNNTGATPVS
jgi:hypothetical protein